MGAIILIIQHDAGCPAVAAVFTYMRSFDRRRAVNALHDLLIGGKFPFARFGAAESAIFVVLSEWCVAIAAACAVGNDPAVIFAAAFGTAD